MRFVMGKYEAFRDRLTMHMSHVLYLPKVDRLYTPHPERPVAVVPTLNCCTTVELTGYAVGSAAGQQACGHFIVGLVC